jgi:hypothetical protein
MRRITLICTIVLLASACGGGDDGVGAASTSGASDTAATPASTSRTPTQESTFPDGSYRSATFTGSDIQAIVPDQHEVAVLDNELAGGDAITWTFKMADGEFAWHYVVEGGEGGSGVGVQGTYTATQDTITFVDTDGWTMEAAWKLAGDDLRLSLGEVDAELTNGVPFKWYVTYVMSEPFTKEV